MYRTRAFAVLVIYAFEKTSPLARKQRSTDFTGAKTDW